MKRNGFFRLIILLIISIVFSLMFVSCASGAAAAEEYFSMGMAYYELGKFQEAEYWLLRAASADRTRVASEYNLGRIAFETGRFYEAQEHFENILERDPDNVIALKAAAYTRIRTGDLETAESYYNRVLDLVPESSDDGYNHALVLYALEKYRDSEEVILRYPFALEENPDALLLLARARGAQGKIETIGDYARWINQNDPNPKVFHEYAMALEKAELYALALENLYASLESMPANPTNIEASQVRFDLARILFIADPGNAEGIAELTMAINQGFDAGTALGILTNDHRIGAEQKNEIINSLESN